MVCDQAVDPFPVLGLKPVLGLIQLIIDSVHGTFCNVCNAYLPEIVFSVFLSLFSFETLQAGVVKIHGS